jgi:hypothetical protein
MFTSFLIPSVFEHVRARHLCVFYAQLGRFGRDDVSFVGEPAYFESPAALEAAGRPEWQASWREAYDYTPPPTLDGVRYEALPADLFTPRLRRVASSWKMYGQLLSRRLPELEAAFGAALTRLDSRERVEAVLLFADNPSVAAVARLRGLPLVHNEYGPLRPPGYVMTGYWDRQGVTRRSEAAQRYRTFRRVSRAEKLPLLSREEMLQVLRRAPLPEAPAPAAAPFRVGVALQGEDNARAHGVDALDLVSMARQRHPREAVLLRPHPAALARWSDALAVPDASPSATAFVQQCETVITVSSGTALEAVLLGRRAVVVGDSPFAIAADRHLDAPRRRDEAEQLRVLNFLVFGYLVPGPLMFDPAYVRWRLTNPCELDIYRYHQRWYRQQWLAGPEPVATSLALGAGAKLLDALPNGDAPVPTVVFGAGHATPGLVAALRPGRFRVQAVFDNDAAKWGRAVSGLPIEAPVFRPKTTVVVSSLTHADAITRQLLTLGYAPDRVLRLR